MQQKRLLPSKLSSAPSEARIEIVPMIDVIFFLLIFFMLIALSRSPSPVQALPVHLPQEASSALKPLLEVSPGTSPLSLKLTQEGRLSLNEQPLAWEDLKIALHLATQSSQEVLFFADPRTPYREIFKVFALVQEVGLTRFSLAATP